MRINEVATRTGVTVRTLHYYDEIGLLKPHVTTAAGYRVYDEHDLSRLQQILFFRELGFPLEEIQRIMQHPGYDRTEALMHHRELLLKKRTHIDGLLELLDGIIDNKEEHLKMDFKAFDTTEIEAAKKQYADEVKERWGDTEAYAESQQRTKDYGKARWNAIDQEGNAIMQEFSAIRTDAPSSAAAQALVKKWQAYITDHFYQCTDEILSGLGQMYTADSRFTENIDRHGAGTAAFMANAIAAYCKKPV